MLAANALGLDWLDTVPDQSSRGKYRSAVTHLDVSCNVLRKAERHDYRVNLPVHDLSRRVCVQGVDEPIECCGRVAARAVADRRGASTASQRCVVHTALCVMRIATDKTTLLESLQAYRETQRARHESDQEYAHPDGEFVRQTFTWKNREFSGMDSARKAKSWNHSLCGGTYDQETYSNRFARELGIAQCQLVRLRPYAVCVAGIDPGKLRAAIRNLQ